MDDDQGLPDGIDPEVWFDCANHPGHRDYLLDEPWQTFPGRMHAWCQTRRVSFRVSKSELPDDLPLATRYWVRGFLTGNVPRQPDDDFHSPAMTEWRRHADLFLTTGVWQPDFDG